jgi:DNA-binding transcriptional LysR family regulator
MTDRQRCPEQDVGGIVDLFHLECFVALAEELHFGRASARLHVGTSALSKRVGDLERELGVRLFERTSRRVRTTTAGMALLDQARRTLAEVQALRAIAADAAAGAVGGLRLVYSPGTGEWMTLLMRSLREQAPEVVITPEQMLSLRVASAVREGSADLGIARVEPGPGLATMKLAVTPLGMVILPASHPLAHQAEITTEDLATEVLLGPPSSLGSGRWSTASTRTRSAEVSTEGEIFDLVSAGFGLFVTTEGAHRRNPRQDLVARPLAGETRFTVEYLLWRPDDDSPLVRRAREVAESLLPAFARLASEGSGLHVHEEQANP